MNRIHIQLYDDFVIRGTHYANILIGETRRIVFPDAYDVGISGKIRYNRDNNSSSLVLNVDEIEPNTFYISIARHQRLIANIDYHGNAEINLNNQFIVDAKRLNMSFNSRSTLRHSPSMEIDIGTSEFTRIDFRMNEGPYFSVSFGAYGIVMARANGNTGVPMFRDLVRSEASTQLVQRSEMITREFLFRFLTETENLPQDAEGLFAAICSHTGIDRFLR